MNPSSPPHKVLCIGDLVADIFAHPVSRLPQPGELALTKNIAIFPGGNALNTAIALRRLGEQVAMAGSIGDDPLGDLLQESMRKYGINTVGIHREVGEATASTLIFRVEGEDRRFLHSLGVAAHFTGEHLPTNLIPRHGIVVVGGYLKLGAWNDDVLADFLESAQRRDSRTVFNVCLAQDSGVDPKRCLKLMNYVDVFVLNEDEARIITHETDLNLQTQTIRRAGAQIAVITRGEKGLFADDGASAIDMNAYRVQIVDPSGCGDCFNAGLTAALLRGWNLRRALEFGSAVGALGASALGCTNGVPSFAQVERFLSENRLGA